MDSATGGDAPGKASSPGLKSQLKASLPRNVLVLGLVSLLTDASSEMMMWTIPFFIALLGGGAVWIGVVEGLRESLSSLLKLASGWFSDRIGRRKVLVVAGYAISTVVKPLLALAAAPWHVLALLGIERVGKGVRTAPRDALIAGVVAESHRAKAFSFHRLMDHSGAVLGLLAGTALVAVLFPLFRDAGDKAPIDVFKTIYLVAAIPAALAVLAGAMLLKEKRTASKKAEVSFRAGYESRFWGFLWLLLLFALGNSSDIFLIVRAGDILGYRAVLTESERAAMASNWAFPWQLPLMFLVLSVAKTIFTMPGGILADRIGRARVLAFGWAVYALVYVAFGFATNAWHAWILFVLYGMFYGFTEGVEKAVVADFARPEVRGAAYGMYAFADGIAKLPASLLFGLLYHRFGAGAAFAFGGSCAGLASVGLLFLIRRGSRPQKAGSSMRAPST